VCGDEDRGLGQMRPDRSQHACGAVLVEPLGRLVEQQDRGTTQDHAGQCDSPRLAPRQAGAAFAEAHVEPSARREGWPEAEVGQKARHVLVASLGRREPQVGVDRSRHESAHLWQDAQPGAQNSFGQVRRRAAIERDAA
jgi:hypothetical protein